MVYAGHENEKNAVLGPVTSVVAPVVNRRWTRFAGQLMRFARLSSFSSVRWQAEAGKIISVYTEIHFRYRP